MKVNIWGETFSVYLWDPTVKKLCNWFTSPYPNQQSGGPLHDYDQWPQDCRSDMPLTILLPEARFSMVIESLEMRVSEQFFDWFMVGLGLIMG